MHKSAFLDWKNPQLYIQNNSDFWYSTIAKNKKLGEVEN